MNDVYQSIGTYKQSFHQKLKRRQCQKEEIAQILYLVDQVREDHPRMSVREIYYKLSPSTVGRDKFEQMCFDKGYRVIQRKNYRRTTNSNGVTRFPNLIKSFEVTGVNQVFVSDITYYEMKGEFYYITLIMDLFNREIVGYSVSDSLRTEQTTLPALHRLIKERGKANIKGSIIHSDGGGQYYSKEFCKLTSSLEMLNSMTEESVFENSHAERLNGIIKNNYLYPYNPKDIRSLRQKLQKAIKMYNQEKPHSSLNHLTPVQYRIKHTVEIENNSSSYYPISTEQHSKHNNINKLSNLVNTI